MPKTQTLVKYELKNQSAYITIDRPERLNALNLNLLDQLILNFTRASQDSEARAVILTGAGAKAFCAGADIDSFYNESQGTISEHAFKEKLVELFELLMTRLGKPTIAKVNGYALGGGFGLAMACDLVVASENASFGTPESQIGLFPMVIMPVLYRNTPRKKLLEMMYTGSKVRASEALELGMINQVVAQDQLDQAVEMLTAKLTSKSSMTLKLGREAFYTMADLPQSTAFAYLKQMLSQNLHTADAREGLEAFLQKRPPQWKDC